jgi:hypothetical protein
MKSENLFGPITQIGYLTDDIETTAAFWTQTSGIGPWTRNVRCFNVYQNGWMNQASSILMLP